MLDRSWSIQLITFLRNPCRDLPHPRKLQKYLMSGSRAVPSCFNSQRSRARQARRYRAVGANASRNSPNFDQEVAFRSWLLRVRIDVASAILLKSCLEESYEHANLPVASPYTRVGNLYSTENTPIENVLY